ncbi:MAG: NADPH:quinone reductase [Subtercola sp.]|nr:NADPH:quinone reductase [Subtercola sp.]
MSPSARRAEGVDRELDKPAGCLNTTLRRRCSDTPARLKDEYEVIDSGIGTECTRRLGAPAECGERAKHAHPVLCDLLRRRERREEGLGEALVAGVQLADATEERAESPPRIGICTRVVDDRPAEAQLVGEGGLDQRRLGWETAVEGRRSHPGLAGDDPHRHVEAPLGEQRAGGLQQALPVLGRVGAEPRRHPGESGPGADLRHLVGHGSHFSQTDGGVRYRHTTAAPSGRGREDAPVQAVTIRTFGRAEGLEPGEVPDPLPAAGQLLIGVEAIGVGGVDAMIRRGTLGNAAFQPGHIPGSEVAGRVLSVGEAVDAAWLGRRVWAFTGVGGGYAEQAVAALDDVTVLPDELSAVDSVALGSAGPVAHFALAHARFAAGERVLVRGAAGSIGVSAVQLAAAGGAGSVAVTTSSPERGDRLQALGADLVLDRSGQRMTGGGDSPETLFDVVVDLIGGEALPRVFDLLAPNGRLVSVGIVGGYPPADFGMALMRAFQRSLSFATFSLNTVPVPERNRVRAELFTAAERGEFRAVVHDVLPLSAAADAHRRMDAGEVFGRIVLTP